MAAAKTEPKKKVEIDEDLDDEDLDLEDEDQDDDEPEKKKPAAKKKESEETPAWAKTIIKLLTPNEQPAAQKIPTPKPPARKEDEADLGRTEPPAEDPAPKRTFLGWFW
jgi:hypothetical protein